MRTTCLLLVGLGLTSLPAQITLVNEASNPPAVFQTTTGTDIAINTNPVSVQVGGGAAERTFSPANQSYLQTGIALDPTQGFTFQWWYRPNRPTSFGYILGDADMVSPLGGYSGGRFRIFQSGACYCPTYIPSNFGGLTFRGVPNEAALIGSPLTNAINTQGYVHLAVRYDPVVNTIDWLVNGVVASSTPQIAGPFNWQGTNLDIMGDRGSSADAGDGSYDGFRIYGYARSDADIAADYTGIPVGMGPSGMTNVPDLAHYEAELALEPHICYISTNGDPLGTTPRRISAGTALTWGGNSPNLPGTPASCLINVWPGAVDPGCTTPGYPSVSLCHGLSSPPGLALIFPDGILLGTIGVGISFPFPYAYAGGGVGATATFTVPLPANLMAAGDALAMQFLGVDGAYPGSLGISNVVRLPWVDALPGPHARIEIRGISSLQVFGFFKVINTGTEGIAQVVFDASPLGPNFGFSPSCALNTGGTLSTGTSYRNGTATTTGLILGTNNGWTGLGLFPFTCGGAIPGSGNGYSGLQFDFADFTPTIDQFDFDSATIPEGIGGASFIGSTVTVTFTNATQLMGTLVADPTDPNAAVLDL